MLVPQLLLAVVSGAVFEQGFGGGKIVCAFGSACGSWLKIEQAAMCDVLLLLYSLGAASCKSRFMLSVH